MSKEEKQTIIDAWKKVGVFFEDETTVFIGHEVVLEAGCFIGAMTVLKGKTVIKEGARIEAFSYIENSCVGNDAVVFSSRVISSTIGNMAMVGPYSYLRGNAVIKPTAQIGSYSEINDTVVGEGSKCKHVSYIGHTNIGQNVNIGAGTITCTYDGKSKYHSAISDEAFVGSGTLIVAPIKIGSRAKTGAGSVVTKDVDSNQLVYGVPARYKKMID